MKRHFPFELKNGLKKLPAEFAIVEVQGLQPSQQSQVAGMILKLVFFQATSKKDLK